MNISKWEQFIEGLRKYDGEMVDMNNAHPKKTVQDCGCFGWYCKVVLDSFGFPTTVYQEYQELFYSTFKGSKEPYSHILEVQRLSYFVQNPLICSFDKGSAYALYSLCEWASGNADIWGNLNGGTLDSSGRAFGSYSDKFTVQFMRLHLESVVGRMKSAEVSA